MLKAKELWRFLQEWASDSFSLLEKTFSICKKGCFAD